jgi:NSS family neurotransmitter:Na+ symporter
MLPLGGLAVALFAGWTMTGAATRDELRMGEAGYRAWRFLIRYVSPIAVATVFIYNLL